MRVTSKCAGKSNMSIRQNTQTHALEHEKLALPVTLLSALLPVCRCSLWPQLRDMPTQRTWGERGGSWRAGRLSLLPQETSQGLLYPQVAVHTTRPLTGLCVEQRHLTAPRHRAHSPLQHPTLPTHAGRSLTTSTLQHTPAPDPACSCLV